MDLTLLMTALLAVGISTPPGTVDELVRAASLSVVAIDVERTKDLPPSVFQPQRISKQGRSVFERPKGPSSGILLDLEGHVLTSNYNVAGEVKTIHVTLATGATFAARVLARSVQDDVALLRLEEPLKSLPFELPGMTGLLNAGESPLPTVGQVVFALGRSPDPTRVTVTRGIVSASARNGGRAIQTDTELNYGNSGGPILNLDGRLVAMAGFVGHIYPQWGQNSGVGFGVTARTLEELLPKLKAGENVTAFRPGFLGIESDPSRTTEGGAKVINVVAGGGAASAGVLKDDVILEIDGKELYDFAHLSRLIFAKKPGEKVQLRVRRGAETITLEAILGEFPR